MPAILSTDVLTPRQLAFIAERLPAPPQAPAEQTSYSRKHRLVGTTLSLLVDRSGTPLSVSVAPGNCRDGALGVLTLANIFTPPIGWLKGFR